MQDCTFCQIIRGAKPASVFYEDEVVLGLMTIGPVTTGHAMIIPKQHAAYLSEMDEVTGCHLWMVTQRAAAIHAPYQRINEIVNGRRGMTPRIALRLAKFFGVSADFWMNLQLRWDLYHAQRSEGKQLERIQPYTAFTGSGG